MSDRWKTWLNGLVCTLALCMCAVTHAEGPPIYPATDSPVFQSGYELPVLSMSEDATVGPPLPPQDMAPAESVLTLPDAYPTKEETIPYCNPCDDEPECRGIKPYGGGHIYDWSWGCGGSPYRTGPGCCSDWQVGPIWDTYVDGMTLFREDANLAAIDAAAMNPDPPLYTNQFNYAGGARLYFTGKIPYDAGYRLQFGYEGVQDWNAAIVYPEETVVMDAVDQQRSIHYNSTLNSAEINVLPMRGYTFLQPYVGFRYIRFADEINDKTDEFLLVAPMDGDVLEDDRTVFDIKNNLIGFQGGLRLDLWQLSQRLSLEGFINGGVYYNAVQRYDSQLTKSTVYSTNMDGDLISTLYTSGTTVKTNPADVAYLAEASLSAVCRVNKCLAVKAGYQFLWIGGLNLASDAYVGSSADSHDMWFDGWHVGAEYRR